MSVLYFFKFTINLIGQGQPQMNEPRVIAGRYRLERLIGQGGIGQVFYGTDLQTDEPVAIKALRPNVIEQNPNLLERFLREGEALKELNHPNIVKMLAAIEENDEHYIVMEYVSGGSLYDLLKQQGKLPIERVLYIALDLCDALTRAHRLKIIHRDIKPANVLLAPDGTPRLTDFGAARLEKLDHLTEEGGIIGTVSYLSPEACKGESIDARIDIWSFGIMLFEMLTGRRPFDRTERLATVIAIVKEPLPDLVTLWPDAPPKLVSLLYRMLEKDPEQRIGSMRQVGAELEATIEQADSGVRQALDLIYRMLERDQDQFPEGMRLVGAKLGSMRKRLPADQTPPRPKVQPLAVDRFEKANRALATPPTQTDAPTSAPAGITRERLLIIGMGAALILLIVIVVVLLLL
jgi:serine/threonine protein kinase